MSSNIGEIRIYDLHDCRCGDAVLSDLAQWREFWDQDKLLQEVLTPFAVSSKQFEPGGYTVVVGLMESHLAIHTWPEKKFVSLDLFSCADEFPEGAINTIVEFFNPENVNAQIIERGKVAIPTHGGGLWRWNTP